MSALTYVSPRVVVADSTWRDKLDQRATRLVLEVYKDACRKDADGPRRAFDAALESYLKAYPHVGKELAGHAVAHILARSGV